VLEVCKDLGLLLGKGGLYGSVIRFSPPMCLTMADANFMLEVFDAAFSTL
jgi:alanine-glyoxylate transaminase/(R)-3-amino-2-methylpropionate-pyruvate transaminase